MVPKKKDAVIAISSDDFHKYGCPHCGCAVGSRSAFGHATTAIACRDCKKIFCILYNGQKTSTIGIDGYFPAVEEHPRKDFPLSLARETDKETDGVSDR